MPGTTRKRSLQGDGEVGGIGIPKNIPRDPVLCDRLPGAHDLDIFLAHIAVGVGESRLDIVVADPNDVPTQLTFTDDAVSKLSIFQLIPSIL